MAVNGLFQVDRFHRLMGDSLCGSSFCPAMNVYEHSDRYEVEMEVPGLTREDLSILLEEGVLTISGEMKGLEGKGAEVISERYRGKFQRKIRFSECEAEGASSRLENGVLVVTLLKAAKHRPKMIPIL